VTPWLRRIAAALAALLLAGTAAAERPTCPPAVPATADSPAPARDRGLLWKATRDGRTLHLYGTLHVGKPQWRKLGPLTAAALKQAEVLALELDPNDPALQQAMADLRHPELPAALQQRLQRAYERACMASEALAALHPLLQATTLLVMEARWFGLDSSHAMEQILIAAHRPDAKGGTRRLVALESALDQLKVLVPTDAAEAASQLEQTLQQLEDQSARRVLQRLAEAWEQGDLATLEDYGRWCECADSEADRAFLKKLNDERNTGLADAIEAQHRGGRRLFVAVGALHMTGEQSLPRLLAQRGFRVERVALRK
jgi:uncharacterized protein YbaP (TraB family)